jgi:hypothetical protein
MISAVLKVKLHLLRFILQELMLRSAPPLPTWTNDVVSVDLQVASSGIICRGVLKHHLKCYCLTTLLFSARNLAKGLSPDPGRQSRLYKRAGSHFENDLQGCLCTRF